MSTSPENVPESIRLAYDLFVRTACFPIPQKTETGTWAILEPILLTYDKTLKKWIEEHGLAMLEGGAKGNKMYEASLAAKHREQILDLVKLDERFPTAEKLNAFIFLWVIRKSTLDDNRGRLDIYAEVMESNFPELRGRILREQCPVFLTL